jgi:4,5-DOPA dioxygenase extradiol
MLRELDRREFAAGAAAAALASLARARPEEEPNVTAVPALPTLFVSHGAPNLILSDLPVKGFLEQLGKLAPNPRAILCVSAHWLTREPTVDVSPKPKTIHDFYGFEDELYSLHYAAPGAVELATEVADTLAGAGLNVKREERGLDHGAWVPLKLAYSKASLPVTQLSLQPGRSQEHHYKLGLALAKLRHAGVLVIGSGGATHNLGELGEGSTLPKWAADFDTWLDAHATAGDAEALIDYRQRVPNAARNHPTEDHYLPILVALGAAGDKARGTTLHASAAYGSLSLRAFSFAS